MDAIRSSARRVSAGLHRKVSSDDRNPIVEFGHWEGKHVVVAGNLSDTEKEISVKAGERFLNVTLAPHTFHSFVEK